MEPPLLKRLRSAHWVALDGVVAVVTALVTLRAAHGTLGGPVWSSVVATLLSTAAIATRRLWSRRWLTVGTPLLALTTAVSAFPLVSIALGFVLYPAEQRLPRRTSRRLLGGTLVLMAAGLGGYLPLGLARPAFFSSPALVLAQLAVAAAGWELGLLVDQQRRYTTGLRDQEAHRAAAELADTKRALSDERLRIARELHDVLAHSMSLIAVQAGVANHVAAERPDEARRALAAIEETSRGTLRELRALLGVLRTPDAGAGPEALPAPALADLDALVARTAEAGVRVALTETGTRPTTLSAGLELALYRVVQESLTNVVKHAATDRCRVLLTFRRDAVAVEIVDTGHGRSPAPSASGSSGHGIAGMRERVGMYGGELSVGPLPGRGFRVAARFPLPVGEHRPQEAAP